LISNESIVAVEYNGWHGSLLEVLLPLSRAGPCSQCLLERR